VAGWKLNYEVEHLLGKVFDMYEGPLF